jgi:hypothetical protein
MVRACRPPAREPSNSLFVRRSTMATSTPANVNSPANIVPVGPPPAITTACSIIATPRPSSRQSRPTHPIPRAPRRRATHTSTTTHAFRASHFRRFWPRLAIVRHDWCLAASSPVSYILEVERGKYSPFRLSIVDRQALCGDAHARTIGLPGANGCSRRTRSSSPSSGKPARTSRSALNCPTTSRNGSDNCRSAAFSISRQYWYSSRDDDFSHS